MRDSIVTCKKCELYKYQKPLVDKKISADIMIVGISAKKTKSVDEIPLDGHTRSGKLVDDIESIANKYDLSIYRTNIVKCVPLNQENKIRYPNNLELQACFDNFLLEVEKVKPKIIILLGDMVRNIIAKEWKVILDKPTDTNLPMKEYENIIIISSYHPSYILRSKNRKEKFLNMLEKQLKGISEIRHERKL